jgi:hypothetical protein
LSLESTHRPLQFIATLESNILAAIQQLVNVTITKVVSGSISVSSSIAFTTAAAALEGQSAQAAVLQSNDVSSIFGDSFGTVTVTGVSKGSTTSPYANMHVSLHLLSLCTFNNSV